MHACVCAEWWWGGLGHVSPFGALQMPDHFDQAVVLNQLRYSGMLETVRIRKAGYAVRRPFQDFYKRQDRRAPILFQCKGIGKGS